VYPRAFEYYVAHSVEDAVAMLSRYGDEARVLAGGQSLIPLMKLRLASPSHLIDIGRVTELRAIAHGSGSLSLGALATHASVLESRLVRGVFPMIADAVGVIGDTQVRNWGTVGGALAEADPAGDWGAVALALKARLRCVSPRGERLLDSDGFFTDAYTTRLAPDELIVEILFPEPTEGTGGAYLKLERRAGDFAVAGVAVQLSLAEKFICQDISIALAAAGLTPLRAGAAADFLRGKELSRDFIDEAARWVASDAEPATDIRGSEEYKRAAFAELFKQAVEIALRRAQGSQAETGHVR
jgi:carbon-monoxide dehydrogenase medium subunit